MNPQDDWEDQFVRLLGLVPGKAQHFITLEAWKERVAEGIYRDVNGQGYLCTEIDIGCMPIPQCSDIHVLPSQTATYNFPSWCTHILWCKTPF